MNVSSILKMEDINHELDLGFKQDMEKETGGQFGARNKEKHLRCPGKVQKKEISLQQALLRVSFILGP